MQKETLWKQFEALLRNPSEEAMGEFFSMVRCEIGGIPTCPRCNSGHVVKMGFNPRRHVPEQQYRCGKCRHVYTNTSIRTQKLRQKYPKCKRCGHPVKRSGFWKWTLSNGQKKRLQRYECTNCECGAFFSQGPPELTES